MKQIFLLSILLLTMVACSVEKTNDKKQMVLLAPAHFHASLLQKNAIPGVSDTVLIYAPEGKELADYLATVESFNTRTENPTHWVCKVYSDSDWLEVFPEASKGDFVVLAGNNRYKTDYILKSIEKGYNVLSDKPMAIQSADYEKLQQAYALAQEKGLVLYDLMTERYDALSIITRELIADKALTGKDTNDRIEIEDVHHFCKLVNGKPTQRPWWYYDVRSQGEGIADVSTHYIDLIWWQCFQNQEVKDENVRLDSAWHYPTVINPEQYGLSTGLDSIPEALKTFVNENGNLEVFSNGGIDFTSFERPIRFEVRWDFQATEGAGDTYRCTIPFETAVIRICQNAETGWNRVIFVDTDEARAKAAEARLQKSFGFVKFEPVGEGSWKVTVPAENRTSHEEHFNKVALTFISLIDGAEMPSWERTNTLTKYRLTTDAVNYTHASRN